MSAFCGIRSSSTFDLSFPSRVRLSSTFTTRTRVSFPEKLFFCQAIPADSEIEGGSYSVMISPSLLASEKEEAKAVLSLFLKKQGVANDLAARTCKKSGLFIDHLISRLYSVYKTRYLIGRELTTLEIREALIPYLESLLEEYGDILVNMVENFPEAPIKEKRTAPVELVTPIPLPQSALESRKQKAMTLVSETDPAGDLPPRIAYLVDLGLDLDKIKGITRRFPSFAYYTLDGKIKPVVEFFLDLGIPKSGIATIIYKRPQLCGISLSENLIPTMSFLEKMGVDKKKWAKVIFRFPHLLTYSRQKLTATVDFLYEMGLTSESIGKILTRSPAIMSYSVEEKLRPTAEYFRSLGADVTVILLRCPQTFALSIDASLKPTTEFFLERGYSVEEIGTMVSRYGALYSFSVAENLTPKWEFFLTMDYPRSELVKFPQYFGYSLEGRIKPRYALVRENGVRMLLNRLLSLSARRFDTALKNKINVKLSVEASSVADNTDNLQSDTEQ